MDDRLLWWLRLQEGIKRIAASRWHPRAWACRRLAEAYVPLLLLVILVAYSLVPNGGALKTFSATVIALLVVADVLLFNTMVAFITQHPRMAMRTVVFALLSYIAMALAWGVLYRAMPPKAFSPPLLTDFDAAYFSMVTLATVGYGDINPAQGYGLAQAVVVLEIVCGLYFLAALFTVMASWAGATPDVPSLKALQREVEHQSGAAE